VAAAAAVGDRNRRLAEHTGDRTDQRLYRGTTVDRPTAAAANRVAVVVTPVQCHSTGRSQFGRSLLTYGLPTGNRL